ncbi:MAG TPA: PIN domain-containing protein [Blastocatellia bacterium]|nr:PIN domain-containing protein [Blastocatellia bacterium]
MPVAPVIDDTSLVLDTDVLTDWRYGHANTRQAIKDYISRLNRPPALASINVFEAVHGFERILAKPGADIERVRADLAKTEKFIGLCTVLSLDENAARIAAYVFARLPKKSQNAHWCDVLIAATALSHGFGVATRNWKDFDLIAAHLPATNQVLRVALWKP